MPDQAQEITFLVAGQSVSAARLPYDAHAMPVGLEGAKIVLLTLAR
jgi:hypothetical protein